MRTDLVSICIPTFNGERYLKECLDSVLKQTYKNCEILIVDDCSTDGTENLLKEYTSRDQRIIFHKNKLNIGLVANWNKCLEFAKGDWIKFVFQDDVIAENCVEKMLNASKAHSLVVCERKFIFDGSVSEAVKKYYGTDLLTLKKLTRGSENTNLSSAQISGFTIANLALNFIGEPSSVLFKKEMVSKFGNFNTDLTQICDLEYWLRLGTNSGLLYMPEELVHFRIHKSSASSSNVISSVKFRPRFMDVVILAHEMLFSSNYVSFRNFCDGTHLKKIKNYLKVKLFEARSAAQKGLVEDLLFLENTVGKYSGLKQFYNTSFLTKLMFQLVLLKRKLKR